MDAIAARVGALDRAQLIQTVRNMGCRFELDFTDNFLHTLSLSRLRHIVIAASLHDLNQSDKAEQPIS